MEERPTLLITRGAKMPDELFKVVSKVDDNCYFVDSLGPKPTLIDPSHLLRVIEPDSLHYAQFLEIYETQQQENQKLRNTCIEVIDWYNLKRDLLTDQHRKRLQAALELLES